MKTSEYNINIKIPAWLDNMIILLVLLYRRLRYGYPFRRIPLTQGMHAIVDPADFPSLNEYKWRICNGKNTFYAERSIRLPTGRSSRILMHRQVLNVPEGFVIDHINRNGLDNRRANLRLATIAQNAWNSRRRKNRSGYKGVWFAKDKARFHAAVWYNNKRIYLGYFNSPISAALEYDRAAKKYHKEFASLNFPHIRK